MNLLRLCALSFLLTAAQAAGGEIVFDYSLAAGDWEVSSFEGAEVIYCLEGAVGFEEGQPNLPVVSRCFVIPQGTSITGASLDVLSEQVLLGRHDILPVRLVPLGRVPGPFVRDPLVYLSDDPFPAERVISVSTGERTGFRLGTAAFTPFRYSPLSGTLSVVTSARLVLTWESDPSAAVFALTPMQVASASRILQHVVRNPEDLEAFAPPLDSYRDGTVWVAVGSSALETALQPLVDHRNACGISAEYVTTEWIYANYAGWDTQEQIRNFLKDRFTNEGLVYALLVGDWGGTQRISSLRIGGDSLLLGETTDLYYSDLTRMWDGDGDHLYGENSDWVDYFADISVGRFSSDAVQHIQTMVDKTIEYETASPEGPWRTTALLCGAGLWPEVEPGGYWGSFVCDSIAERTPPPWVDLKLYETTAGHPVNQIELVNEGVSYVSAQGHGASSGVYWYFDPGNMFTNQNYTGMDNWGMFPVFHSMACNPGQLSVNGCSAERLMMWPYGGAIAVMYNSNYGWGTPPAMGPSEHLEVQFANMMFVFGIERIGDMQAGARDAFKAWGSIACQNWVLQENNMLGDPATLFVTHQTGIEGGAGPSAPGALLGPAVPNPGSGVFTMAWASSGAGACSFSIYDLSGRLVRRIEAYGAGESGVLQFDGLDQSGAALPPGCYSVVLRRGSSMASSRVIIVRERP